MTSTAVIGGLALGMPIGWASIASLSLRGRLAQIALSAAALPAALAPAISASAALASLPGLAAGLGLRLAFDFVLTRQTTA